MKYITLKDMGSSGGLCSQLQIFAGLSAVAKANGMKIAFSEKMLAGETTRYPHTQEIIQTKIRIFDLLELEYEIKPEEFFNNFKDKHINFHTTTYDHTLFELDQSYNYNLVGRFDLYTYWYNDIGDKVSSWEYKYDLQVGANKRMEEIKKKFANDKPVVSIHIRRGDYLLPGFSFCELDADYYTKAIVDHFLPVEDYNFLVFSNDIEFAKELFEGGNIHFVDPERGDKVCTDSEKEDLALMSLCDHFIIANSSYSWWGAFLSKSLNKKVICPTNWLLANHQSSWMNGNYFPPTWINIDNKN
jgi:hypothetical protein